jgi:hypothetical protein
MKKIADPYRHSRASCTRGQKRGSSSPSKVGARCVSSARRDLCGLRLETACNPVAWNGGRGCLAGSRATGGPKREAYLPGLPIASIKPPLSCS